MNKSAAFKAAAMLVTGISFASAQTTAPFSDSGKCWDAASNVVRDKTPTTGRGGGHGLFNRHHRFKGRVRFCRLGSDDRHGAGTNRTSRGDNGRSSGGTAELLSW